MVELGIGKRIVELRTYLKLTQDVFGEKLGVVRSTIAKYENGERTPKESTLKAIQREFNVNPAWLKHGIGEMFLKQDSSIDLMAKLLKNENKAAKTVFAALGKLDEKEWLVIQKIIDEIKNS
ncbi:MAG: helix-turn-helix domain-containing protein [Oscillospiraceae bacterium]|nr:helix-turn-helix domain-containing protein [Oscillospiraceae bacterium]